MKIPNLNPRQWQLVYQSIIGMAGPLAKFISVFFDIDQNVVKVKVDAALDLFMVVTPIISLVWMVATTKSADQIKHVANMPAADKAAAAATLPAATLASVAEALPDNVVVAAAGALPGVNVHVNPSEAPAGAVEAAKDATVPGVNLT